MEQHISPESLQLIANLINDKNRDFDKVLKERHESLESKIRMIKTTVQENHKVSVEGRDYGKITNGRVSKLEDDIYGATDKNGNIIKGRDGILFEIAKIKKWQWLYSDWRVLATIWLATTAIYVEQSRNFLIKIIDKIF